MKKVVVVVDGKPIRFIGENLMAFDVPSSVSIAESSVSGKILVIQDNHSDKSVEPLATFQKWDYWYNPSKIEPS